ncbi:MAG: hypothetical protein Q9178_003224 [Gyalolechia marmorata]
MVTSGYRAGPWFDIRQLLIKLLEQPDEKGDESRLFLGEKKDSQGHRKTQLRSFGDHKTFAALFSMNDVIAASVLQGQEAMEDGMVSPLPVQVLTQWSTARQVLLCPALQALLDMNYKAGKSNGSVQRWAFLNFCHDICIKGSDLMQVKRIDASDVENIIVEKMMRPWGRKESKGMRSIFLVLLDNGQEE